MKRCYQCDNLVNYLFDDGRGKCCTRLTPEEVRGDSVEAGFDECSASGESCYYELTKQPGGEQLPHCRYCGKPEAEMQL